MSWFGQRFFSFSGWLIRCAYDGRGSRVLFLFFLALFGGCLQANVERELHYGVENVTASQLPVWPSAPEVPRYIYAGQLLGVENFVVSKAGQKELESAHNSQQALMWLVGLDPNATAGDHDTKQGLQRPQTGVVDAAGRIYVTDIGQNAVVVFDQVAGQLRIWREATSRNPFAAPVGIAMGANKQILVADAELGLVVQLDLDGNPVGSFGEGVLQRPTGLTRDVATGRIYVADSLAHDIKIFDDTGKLLKSFGRQGQMPGEFNAPTHLTFDKNRLYVADTLNARIQVFDGGGEFLSTFGQRGLLVGNLVRPKGVAVDGQGNIYVVESLHDHLLIYNPKGEFLLPIGGTGKEVGRFYLPSGVWSDGANRLFVADMFNGRVMIFRYLGGGK